MSINLPTIVNGVEMPKCCANCDFYLPPLPMGEGTCRRNPPQIFVVYTKIKDEGGEEKEVANGHCTWTPVQPNMLCGEWQFRETQEPVLTGTVHLDMSR